MEEIITMNVFRIFFVCILKHMKSTQFWYLLNVSTPSLSNYYHSKMIIFLKYMFYFWAFWKDKRHIILMFYSFIFNLIWTNRQKFIKKFKVCWVCYLHEWIEIMQTLNKMIFKVSELLDFCFRYQIHNLRWLHYQGNT